MVSCVDWTIFSTKSHPFIPLVLSAPGAINIMFENVPPGDDYYFLFINSTIGQMYALSSTFAILEADATPSPSPPSPVGGVPTVTVNGTTSPSPTFGTTFATLPGGAVALFSSSQINALLLTLLGCGFGASLILGWWFTHMPSASFTTSHQTSPPPPTNTYPTILYITTTCITQPYGHTVVSPHFSFGQFLRVSNPDYFRFISIRCLLL